MDLQNKMKELHELLDELNVYYRSIGKLSFDLECCAPPDGMDQAGADMAVLEKHTFALTHSDRYVSLITELYEHREELTAIEKRLVSNLYEGYEKTKNQSPEFAYEASKIGAQAYGDWLKAKQASDFSAYMPTMEKLVRITREGIDLRDHKLATWYDTALNDYEKGTDIASLDAFFGALKERIVPLVKRVHEEGKTIRTDFMTREVSIDKQEKMSRFILEKEGLKTSSLVLMTTEHPFTTNFGPKDVRVTTHYHEDLFLSNIFTTLHEGGHALFMQNEPEELYSQHADNAMSNGMHECISRFYENLIGRSEAFVHFLMPTIREASDGTFDDITEREMYEAANAVTDTPIRCEADELTYCLHILIRYELEKGFVNGTIKLEDVPAEWNRRYKEYLGIDVKNDAEGCLQDVHWSGMFGYFPSYALGNAYGAQILNTMKKDFDVDSAVREGRLDLILDWLKSHVFSCASMLDPKEWLETITGEGLNVNYFLDYLEAKYTELYDLK